MLRLEQQQREYERQAPQRAEAARLLAIESEERERKEQREKRLGRLTLALFIGCQVTMYAAAAVSERFEPSMISAISSITVLVSNGVSFVTGFILWDKDGLGASLLLTVVFIILILWVW